MTADLDRPSDRASRSMTSTNAASSFMPINFSLMTLLVGACFMVVNIDPFITQCKNYLELFLC